MMFGAVTVQREASNELVEKAQLAEEAGFDMLGFGDSQTGFRELYSTLGIIARETSEIGIGPTVTNAVTRHPVVTASAISTINEVADGRAFLGIGTGDSAVRTLGKRPSRLTELEDAIRVISTLTAGEVATYEETDVELRWVRRENLNFDIPIVMAAEGPKSLRTSGRVADHVMIGTGLTEGLITESIEAIREGARESGRDPAEITTWVYAQVSIGDTFEQAATAIKASLASGAHHRYSYTLEGKEVPGAYRDSLKGLVSEYEPKRHVERGETVNADLIDKYDLLEFLGKRIAIAGPVVSCIDQLQSLDEIEGLDGILVPTLVVDDEWDLLTQFGDDIMPAV